MVVTLTSEAEYFTACTFDCINLHINFNAISTVNPSAELIASICCNERLADFLLQLIQKKLTLFSIEAEHAVDSLEEDWAFAIITHAGGKGGALLDGCLQVAHPALNAEVVTADVVVNWDIIRVADLAESLHSSVEV